jgi:four helix bundle protein
MDSVSVDSVFTESLDFTQKIISLCRKLNDQKQSAYSKYILESSSRLSVNLNDVVLYRVNDALLSSLSEAGKQAEEMLYWLQRMTKDKNVRIDIEEYIRNCQEIREKIDIINRKANS